jgi:hypothetical protein
MLSIADIIEAVDSYTGGRFAVVLTSTEDECAAGDLIEPETGAIAGAWSLEMHGYAAPYISWA